MESGEAEEVLTMIKPKQLLIVISVIIFTFIGDILALFGIGIPFKGHILSWGFLSQNIMVILIVVYCMRHFEDDRAFLWIAVIAVASLIILPIELIMQM
jgi:hypothetical protein